MKYLKDHNQMKFCKNKDKKYVLKLIITRINRTYGSIQGNQDLIYNTKRTNKRMEKDRYDNILFEYIN